MASRTDSVQAVRAGDRLALSRLLTEVENETPAGIESLDALFPFTGQAHIVGVTGAPGAGKSSLVNRIAQQLRQPGVDGKQVKVAILAVDPSSPFTGGAILGDRVRMRDIASDPGIFIRSMASRGALGGLAHSTAALSQALDAAGYDVVIIETVGAGQSEVDIARLAHTTLVVDAPGMGDDIQAIKAGIMEIADILVVNKADRPGVEHAERALRANLELARILHPETEQAWMPPVHCTIATTGKGVEEVVQSIRDHRAYLTRSGERIQRDRRRLEHELMSLLQSSLMQRWQTALVDGIYQQTLERLVQRTISPFQAVEILLENSGLQ